MSIPSIRSGAGITKSGTSLGGVAWTILGQTYKPVQLSAGSFAFEALFPPGTFVPPHIHHNEDKYIRMLSGTFALWFDGEALSAGPGDLIRMPRGLKHGIANTSDRDVHALFWFAPARDLYAMFTALDGRTDPAEVMRIVTAHNVEFLTSEQ